MSAQPDFKNWQIMSTSEQPNIKDWQDLIGNKYPGYNSESEPNNRL